jgi:hypothetical protein
MLRRAQQSGKIINDIKTQSVVPSVYSGQTLSPVEGLPGSFSTAGKETIKENPRGCDLEKQIRHEQRQSRY